MDAKTWLDLIREAIAGNCKKPLILLTGQGNRKIDILAMEAGVADYLLKSELTAEKKEHCIRYAISSQDFITTIQATAQKFPSVF